MVVQVVHDSDDDDELREKGGKREKNELMEQHVK